MPKKEEQKSQAKQEAGKSKELKIVTVQVVTKDKVVKNPRQMALLYIIDSLGPLHERTLHDIVKHIQDLGGDLGYEFKSLGVGLHCPELKNDLIALTYVGFVEVDPVKRKYRSTGEGKEALEKYGAPPGVVRIVEENKVNLKNLVALFDSQIDMQLKRRSERPTQRFPSLRFKVM
jgi:hypothetical protein